MPEARVEVFSQEDEAWLDAVGRRPFAVCRTDRDGRFSIPDADSGAYVFLVRAEGKEGEMAVRTAIGASRNRIGWEYLKESLLLGVMGGGAGLEEGWRGR